MFYVDCTIPEMEYRRDSHLYDYRDPAYLNHIQAQCNETLEFLAALDREAEDEECNLNPG